MVTNQFLSGSIFIFVTLSGTICGQLMIKKGMLQLDPDSSQQIIKTLMTGLINPWVLAGLFMAVVAACGWILTLSRLPLSFAYPFLSITFPIVVIASSILFKEEVSLNTYFGLIFIIIGIFVVSRSG